MYGAGKLFKYQFLLFGVLEDHGIPFIAFRRQDTAFECGRLHAETKRQIAGSREHCGICVFRKDKFDVQSVGQQVMILVLKEESSGEKVFKPVSLTEIQFKDRPRCLCRGISVRHIGSVQAP